MKKLLFLMFFLLINVEVVTATTYYVDANKGADTNQGTVEAPFSTIQKAADVVSAGDVVVVRDGVYYGPVNIKAKGTKDAPILFKTENPGFENVIITNANPEIREKKNLWTLYDEEKDIYVTDYTVHCNADVDAGDEASWLFPARVLSDDVDLFPYGSYSALENENVSDDMEYKSYDSGFHYDNANKKLYIRLNEKYGSKNPNEHIIKVSPTSYGYISVSNMDKNGWWGPAYQYDALGYDSFNVCIGDYNAPLPEEENIAAESYYVTLEGFTFETPGFCGVYLRASDCTIKGCYFRGCRAGVRGAARVRQGDTIYSKNIVVEYCDFTQFPTYTDAYDFILDNYKDEDVVEANTYFWWQRKYGSSGIMGQCNYENGGFVSHIGEYWTLRYNYLHDCFDAISYGAMRKYSVVKEGAEYEVPAEHIEIYGNKFEKCLDNCIEFENRAYDVRVYENYFYNNFIPFSWQPLNGTPWPTNIRIYKNLIHNTPDFNCFWNEKAGFMPKVFKIGAYKGQWANFPWMADDEWDETYDIPKAPVTPEGKGFRVFNNTIIMTGGEFLENVSGQYREKMSFDNFMFYNNFILSRAWVSGNKENDIMEAYIMKENQGMEFSNNIFAPDIQGNYKITDGTLENGILLYSPKSAGFKNLTRLRADVTLEGDSPLIGAGTRLDGEYNSKDYVGALAYGEENIFLKNFGPEALQNE